MKYIDVTVSGQFASLSSDKGGVQGEGNATTLRITFDSTWNGYTRRITWHDARGENPVAVLLSSPYQTPIPSEALAVAGWCSFTIEGYLAATPNQIALTAERRLLVELNTTVYTPAEPTASQALQLHGEIEAHIANKANPHSVTKAQIGLGNINNTADLDKPISTAAQSALNRKANLDKSGKIISEQLPDIERVVFEYDTLKDFPIPGAAGRIYISKDTNTQYRWNGSEYVGIGGVVTAEQLGLGNVDNTSDASKPISTAAATEFTNLHDRINGITTYGAVKTVLDVPTYDSNPSTGHPSVVFVENGWNGYRYWMADTPFPDEARENPSIFSSNDGVKWVIPAGAPNPVVTQAEIQQDGYGHGSDTNLIMLPDNRLALYYRASAGSKEAIYRLISTDGKTWGDKYRCLDITATGNTVLSPAVVIDNGTYYMYTVNAATEPHKIQRRTSADGVNWGAPVDTSHPLFRAWHMEVNLFGGVYRMLISEYPTWDMIYLKSKDGLTWTQPYEHPAIKRSGEEYDINGYYKAAMVPVAGQPLLFDIWVTCLSSFSHINIYDPSCVWRTQYLKNVDLEYGTNSAIYENLVFKKGVNRVWMSAREMLSDCQAVSQNTLAPAYIFPESVNSRATGSIMLPNYWERVKVSVWWVNRTTLSGNVRFKLERHSLKDGNSFDTASNVQVEGKQPTSAGRYYVTKTEFDYVYNSASPEDTLTCFYIERQGTDERDTLAGAVAFLGVMFEGIQG